MELWNGIFQDIELLYPIHRDEDQDIEPKVK
jgi:hypothetical protein